MSIQTTDVRVYIVDDNANHAAGIKQLLELHAEYRIVGIATSGEEATRRIGQLKPDIVLMDLQMPEVDGVTATYRILSAHPGARILALTGYDDADLVFRAMRAGAKGYILKTMVTAQLVNAIREVMAGRIWLPPSLTTKFFDTFHTRLQKASRPDPNRQALLNYLTTREKEVLKLLTEGVTYKGVADKLVISETTVKTHVNNIFQKLQVNDRTQAVLYALKNGLVEPPAGSNPADDIADRLPLAV